LFQLMKVFVLIALIKISVTSDPLQERPYILAILYAVAVAFLNSVFWQGLTPWLATTVGGFLFSWLYFWLLARLEGAGLIWWVVCLLGIPLILL